MDTPAGLVNGSSEVIICAPQDCKRVKQQQAPVSCELLINKSEIIENTKQ